MDPYYGSNVYSSAPLLARGQPGVGAPQGLRDYMGGVSTEISQAYDGKQLLPVSLPGVDNIGKALVQAVPTWQTIHTVNIALLGDELFRIIPTKLIPPDQADVELTGKIFPVSPMVPVTEFTTGDSNVSYGFSYRRTLTQYAKMLQISFEFMRTEEGRRYVTQMLRQLSTSYLLTAIGTILSGVFGMQQAYADWSSKIPSQRTQVSPRAMIRESSQLFAAAAKKNLDGLIAILTARCPNANTAFIPSIYNKSSLFGEVYRDPDLYPDSAVPVYRSSNSITNIVPIPALPTGLTDEVKWTTQSHAAYTTFVTLPPLDGSPPGDALDGLEVYDYRSQNFTFIPRSKLYESVAFDFVEDKNNIDLLTTDPSEVYKDQIQACKEGKAGEDLAKEGFIVLRTFLWEGHAVALCNNKNVTFLTTNPQLLPSISAPQNSLELHARVRMGTEASDAGASAWSMQCPFVTELIGGGSTIPFSREKLRNYGYRVLDPAIRHCGLIVIRCPKEQIESVVNEPYIPANGAWSAAAKAKIGGDSMANVEWTDNDIVLGALRGNYDNGSFAIGSLSDNSIPRMPEVATRDACRRITSKMTHQDEGCAPHGTMTTKEITGEVSRPTNSTMNPDAITKRIRVSG